MTVRDVFNQANNGLQEIQFLLKKMKALDFEKFFLSNKGKELQQEELHNIKFLFDKDNLILKYSDNSIRYFPIGLKQADWEEKDNMLIIYDKQDVLVYDLLTKGIGIDRIFNCKW